MDLFKFGCELTVEIKKSNNTLFYQKKLKGIFERTGWETINMFIYSFMGSLHSTSDSDFFSNSYQWFYMIILLVAYLHSFVFPKIDHIDQFQFPRYLASINNIFIANSFFAQKPYTIHEQLLSLWNIKISRIGDPSNFWNKLQTRKYLLDCLGMDTGVIFNDLVLINWNKRCPLH